ncbi:MAG: hypothetical protein A2319_02605 [Candidatus Kerfeldbacteria bacterium RIFOXYB2_FULL_38_14]|uniref:Uncharacterized protein n=1 Tax=Candidatus Kerfeldbacteria bacterium RIFOXYB2_FULL_38_14 TaxID=1798547 RepID=A0A1G2B8Z2_9BACT|nr:MAG: hypothetical protein A2319_02605 [Candidatus Kerfeldbacteria bacterium RIFOXYB2_FULL_38_14]
MMQKKKKIIVLIAIIGGVILIGGGVVWGFIYQRMQQAGSIAAIGDGVSAPSRAAEINGPIVSIVGNELVVNNIIGGPSEEEKKELQKKMLTASAEEKQAFKESMLAKMQKEPVTIIIPVGITITKDELSTGNPVPTSFSDLQPNKTVSIWLTTDKKVEAVMLRGTSL